MLRGPMRGIHSLTFLLCLWSLNAHCLMNGTCSFLFLKKVSPSTHIETKKNQIYYEFSKGSSPSKDIKNKTMIFIHGLGDSSFNLSQMAALFQAQGYNILLVDLIGHGNNMKSEFLNGTIEHDIIPYGDNVVAILEIIHDLKLKNPILVGHSYGGAIAYLVAKSLEAEANLPSGLVMMSPYIRRLDAFLEYLPSFVLDPYMDIYMEQMFRDYFKDKEDLSNEDEQSGDLKIRIQNAIATTKGIRDFDLLSQDGLIGFKSYLPLLIMEGDLDALVLKDHAKKLSRRARNEGYSHQLVFVKEFDHFYPTVYPKETFRIVQKFISQEILKKNEKKALGE